MQEPILRHDSKLRPLSTVLIKPADVSSRRTALQDLKNVHVSSVSRLKGSGKLLYIVEVEALDNIAPVNSRLPTSTSSRASFFLHNHHQSQIPPVVKIERELREFVHLRDSIYNVVRWAHRRRHCDFCGKMTDLLVFGPNPDAFLLSFFNKRGSTTLRNFVAGILHLTLEFSSVATAYNCEGLTLVPEILHNFLFTPTPFNAPSS